MGASLGNLERTILAAGLTLAATLLAGTPAQAQGCIVARSNGEQGGPESEGGYLAPHEWDFDIGYRHQFSYIHFVGPTEQSYRITDGTQVENKINLENLTATYQISSRFSVTTDVPLLTASRHTNDSPIVYTSAGIGDTSFLASGWIWNPKRNPRGNIQVGFGILLPTGKDNVANTVDALNGKGPVTTIVDYSIQPGQGGWGIPLQWAAFRNWRTSQFYFNGSYTAMLEDINGVLRTGAAANPVTLTQYNAIMDQYLVEGGVAHPISKIRGLTVTFGPRMEGVPARNLFPTGNDLGFRRPGFAVSAEPGIQYVRHGNMISFTIARAIYRDRTRSVPDDLTGGHGDAAFANWVWLASYSFRAGGRHQEIEPPAAHSPMPAQGGSAAVVTAASAPSSVCQ
ncbi:MAG: hypothetical protein WB579_26035 [Bryobacteraceae bacterium]